MTTQSERSRNEAKEILLKDYKIQPGDTIICNLKHVSRSGMYRCISLHVIQDNEIKDISWIASRLLEGYDNKHDGCKASGCGVDMGFHLVYNLGYCLFKDGWDCVGPHCPSNDHTNYYDNAPNYHKDGGYALRCRWL